MRKRLSASWIFAPSLLFGLFLGGGAAVLDARARPAEGMRTYETKFHVIYTDLTDEQAREAAIRVTAMAEEYASRLRDFGGSGRIRRKLPFYLYADAEDYYATGAPRASSGRFNGNALLAVAEEFGPRTWHLVQHEGFHQFSAALINANLPRWVDEGLAEYFGEGVFTGDGYVTGVIPQWRLERVRKRFADHEFIPLREMMSMSADEWDGTLSLAYYDQAWTMVQFLAHGERGRYQAPFRAFLRELGGGQNPLKAWQEIFGRDIPGFEQRWREFWTTLPDDPTGDLYAQATTATLTSYLARAHSRQQSFQDLEAFADAGRGQEIQHHPDDWLPPALLIEALEAADKLAMKGARLELAVPGVPPLPQLHLTMPDGTKLIGRFTLVRGRVGSVTVERQRE